MKPKKTLVDLLLVAGIVVVFWVVASATESSERVEKFSQTYEALQLDELPLTLLVLSLGLLWFAWRRTLVVRTEVNERIRSEHKVQELLKHNSDLAQRLFTAQEDERRSLARELHDEMAQTVTAIRTEAAVLSTQHAASEDVRLSAQRIADAAQQVSQMTRHMLLQLRPLALDSMGLREAVLALCQQWQNSSGIECECEIPDLMDSDAQDYLCVTVYRLVQESLTNVAKHSRATKVLLNLHTTSQGNLLLTIQDNGRGLPAIQNNSQGFGLLGMRERVASLKGSFQLNTEPGQGVEISIELPVKLDTSA
jgi:signal transduction histidine kinase